MDLRTAPLGTRVSVRRVLPGRTGPTGGPAMTDVVGRVVRHSPEHVDVERRDGSVVTLALDDIVTARVVPDGAARRRVRPAADVDADTLTRICTRGWPPVESEPLGDWQLRAAGGFTRRANSAALHGGPGLTAAAAWQRVREWYADRGLPPKAQAVVGSPGERACLAAGWVPAGGTHPGATVQVADLRSASTATSTPTAAAGSAVRTVDRVDDDWLAMYDRAGGIDAEVARAVLEAPPAVGFVRVEDADELLAIGRVVVTGDWAGLSCVEVSPSRRRQGLGRRVVEASLAWALERGAVSAYLQTMSHNAAAIALYAPYGFVDHHDYRYLSPPDAGARVTHVTSFP